MDINLVQLRHALLLAEEGHFGRAADRLHITQSALSRSIQALEARLDTHLFERSRDGVRISPAGKHFLAHARDVLHNAQALQREMKLFNGGGVGDLFCGAGPSPLAAFLADALVELAQDHPNARVHVESGNLEQLSRRLLDERIECFIGDTRFLPAGRMTSIALGKLSVGLFCRAEHVLAQDTAVTTSTLHMQRYASLRLPEWGRDNNLRRLIGLGANGEFPFALLADSFSLLIPATLNSDLVLIAPHRAIRAEFDTGRLVELRMKRQPKLALEMGLVHIANRRLSPLALRLAELCRKALA